MTLTVRLPGALDAELQAYCDAHGLTKSHVVQESLADYLGRGKRAARPTAGREVSPSFRALKKAGLIGCVQGDGVSATKEAVRQRVLGQLKSRA
jgi:hypothetical protein